jgi:hypothetical protein
MSIHRTSKGLQATLFLILLCSPLRSFCGETVRSIATLTLQERMNLPDSTQVTLKWGRTTTLGALRAEHRARMESFQQASALGRALAARLKASTNTNAVMNPPGAAPVLGAGKPGNTTAMKNFAVIANPNAASPPPKAAATTSFVLPRTLVPLPDISSKSPNGILPGDYRDFCKAAGSSACIYLPPNTSFWPGEWVGSKNTPFVAASDPLIMDPSVCAYDGGSLDPYYGCIFYYPMGEVTNFIPNAPISSNASCDPAAHYVVDAKGAVQVRFTATAYTNLEVFTTPQAPVTCAVQVWLWQ